MRELKLTYLCFIMLLILGSCQVIYDDPSIQQDKNILSVQARITDGARPYYVQLSNALPYNDQYTTLAKDVAVKGAKIVLEDNAGNSETLTEQANGLYATSATGIQGVVGRYYTLTIVTKTGDTYKSNACLLNPPLEIDSVYYEKTINQTLNPVTSAITYENGVNIFADLKEVKQHPVYCKFETRVIREIFAYEYPAGPHAPQVNVYVWTVSQLEGIPVLNPNSNPVSNLIKKQTLGFLPQDKMSKNPVVYKDYNITGRIISSYCYSLSEEAYLYYQHVQQQLTAENKLFDPISTNLTSNLKCQNDPSKKVFGLFEASGQSVKHSFVRYNEYENEVYSKNANSDVPDHIKDGVVRDHPPYYDSVPAFWQQF